MLERYRYTIVSIAIVATVLPRLPGIGEQVNGAYLDIHVGSVSFQPSEFAKVAIVIFLASYLSDNRQVLVTAAHRVARADDPTDEAVRSAAARLGRRHGDAPDHA